MTDPAELVTALYDACNAGDAAVVSAVLTDDFRYYSLGAPPLQRGSEWVQTVDEGGVRRIAQIRSYHQDGLLCSDLEGFDYRPFDAAAETGTGGQIVSAAVTDGRLETISRYYDACTAADADWLMELFTEDVVHYFLQPNVGSAAVAGREHLARYWRKVATMIRARWVVERIIARGAHAVIEWSMFWNPDGGAERVVLRGMEWYVFAGELISEIRSYHRQVAEDVELVGFDYAAAGYSTHGGEAGVLHTPRPERA